MKTLQNNFTTPEQSKRLLELGVPEWTADCLIKNNAEKDKPTIRVKEPCTGYYFAHDEYIPCWSVGRLIEIFDICYQEEPEERVVTERWLLSQEAIGNFGSYIEYLVRIFEVQHDFLDFSKLEE